jgi:hypothetical protein
MPSRIAASMMPSRIAAGTFANAGQLGRISSARIANKKWPWRPQPLQCSLSARESTTPGCAGRLRIGGAPSMRGERASLPATAATWASCGRFLVSSSYVRAGISLVASTLNSSRGVGWVRGCFSSRPPRSAVDSAATSTQERMNLIFSPSPQTCVAKAKNGPHPCCANTFSSVLKTCRRASLSSCMMTS